MTILIMGKTGLEKQTMSITEEKDIYISIIKQKLYRLHISEVKWFDHFMPEYNDLREVWPALKNNIVSERTRTCIWEQIHLNFFTTYWFNKISKENKNCPLCKEVPQSIKHIILNFSLVKKLWKEIEGKLQALVPVPVNEKEMAFGLTKEYNKPEYKVRNWITYKLRESISRQERTTYDKPQINNEKQIKVKFNKEISRELTYKHLLYKKEGNLEKFFETFNCSNELVKIEDDKIVVIKLL